MKFLRAISPWHVAAEAPEYLKPEDVLQISRKKKKILPRVRCKKAAAMLEKIMLVKLKLSMT